jgi:hypothetical protein
LLEKFDECCKIDPSKENTSNDKMLAAIDGLEGNVIA